MAQLVRGEWVDTAPAAEETGKDGRFRREDSAFRGTISADPAAEFPAQAGRYQLWVAWVCPWAGRTLAWRALKGLTDVIDVRYAQPGLPKQGWVFDEGPDGPVESGYPLHRLYVEHDPLYTGKVSVPVLWDRQSRRIVNNESSEIIRILNSAFDGITGNRHDLYPAPLRDQIDRWNDLIYPTLNNGVYRSGFAATQHAYDEAVCQVFDTLDTMEAHLATHRYLAGEWLTEADWRAFATLVRFDVGYYGAFKCNLRKIDEYPALSHYLRELYQWPGIAETVRLDLIHSGYYQIADKHGIVAIGPRVDLTTPHDRERLPGNGIWERGI
ncbi:glutathione S-transferase family protein [Altererythrobacter xixiisoli]|uniref:Glutathione S-transferase family protein n=1 Tax=Croceibacterium xixiisoli TaxID=1476466 RepID=A0A6I4TXC3_9SPHN|nr:glutathione S-transferase C-terminal domain-containing protein [Croceibacterium xixiisoli]MXO99741.1 glutathione S-transferase family protein [Croceibacterium xixiisoli]